MRDRREEEWLENLQGEEIWIANKYVDKTSSDEAQAHVPMLKCKEENGAVVEVETNKAKSHFYSKASFHRTRLRHLARWTTAILNQHFPSVL